MHCPRAAPRRRRRRAGWSAPSTKRCGSGSDSPWWWRAASHKFGQDAGLRAFLLNTGDRVLVEASPLDRIWGIGMAADDPRAEDPARWRGLNLLGFALMEARTRLRAMPDAM
ncbi:hypothetical protein GCM10018966_051670 [Streptomyces yanii]